MVFASHAPPKFLVLQVSIVVQSLAASNAYKIVNVHQTIVLQKVIARLVDHLHNAPHNIALMECVLLVLQALNVHRQIIVQVMEHVLLVMILHNALLHYAQTECV